MLHPLVKGTKWAALECVDKVYHEVPEDGGRGVIDYRKVKVYVLKCDCGKTFTTPVSMFLGRQKVKDCGCGAGWRGNKATATFSIPADMKAAILDFALAEQINNSQAFTTIARWGLAEMKRRQLAKEKELSAEIEKSERSRV